MCKTRNRIAALVTASLVTASFVTAATSSVAAALPFTWNPGGASPALGSSAFTADTIFTTNYLTDVGQLDGSGRTRQIDVVTGFALGGNPVSPVGFGSSYGLYFEVLDTHTNGPLPQIIRFSSLNFSLKADPRNQNGTAFATVAGAGFANTGATGEADDITLATGSLVSSSTFLNVASGVLDARSATTFLPAVGEAGFFVSPPPRRVGVAGQFFF